MSTAFDTVLPRIERELVEFVREKKGLKDAHIHGPRLCVDTGYAGVLPSL